MKQLLLFMLLLFSGITQLSGIVIEAPNLITLEKQIDALDENGLVVLDIDYTILIPNDQLLRPCGEKYIHQASKKIPNFQEKEALLFSKVLQQSKVSLVDEKLITLLQKIKEKRCKVIALTAMQTGTCGLIKNMEEWRVAQLDSLGIDFRETFPQFDSMVVNGFEEAPLFTKGIIASAHHPKGQVLTAFLKQVGWKPSKILFVDDRMENIDSVECELEKEGISHVSFYYTAVFDLPSYFDEKIADLQIQTLLQKGVWLSDEEAKGQLYP